MDILMSPYSNGINLKKHMDFDTDSETSEQDVDQINNVNCSLSQSCDPTQWKNLSSFILKENKQVFRSVLKNIN